MPQIEVTFDINVDGILTVYAKDLGTGKMQQVTVSSKTYMSEAEIERAIREAQQYEQTDAEEAEKTVKRRKHFFRHH